MKKIFAIILGVAALSGCYRSDVYNTYHPYEAKVEFTYNDEGSDPETGAMSLLDIGGEFTLYFDGEEYDFSPGETIEIPYLLETGSYSYYIYNVVDDGGLSISKTEVAPTNVGFDVDREEELILATVGEYEDKIATASHDLYFGTATFTLQADTDYSIAASLYAVTRDLNITIKLDGDSDYLLESVTATLSGVASEWDCINDVPYAGSTAVVDFDIEYDDDDYYYLESSTKLLGIYGNEQTLTIEMNYEGGNPATHTVTSDLSGDLAAFNTNKKEPCNLGTTYDVPNESATGGVITGWNPEDEGDVDIK